MKIHWLDENYFKPRSENEKAIKTYIQLIHVLTLRKYVVFRVCKSILQTKQYLFVGFTQSSRLYLPFVFFSENDVQFLMQKHPDILQ